MTRTLTAPESPVASVAQLERLAAQASPADFARIASAGTWRIAAHLKLISDLLVQALTEPLRLIVTIMPRAGKTQLISRYTPAWILGMQPTWKVMLASYEAGFAREQGREARDILLEHAGLFDSGVTVRTDVTAADAWLTEQGGGMISVGVGGALTGRGANLLLIDDPVKSHEEAYSEVYRNKTWDWFRSVAYTRLEPDASVVLLMTRWHEDDLAGRILADPELGDKWTLVRLPAIVEEDDLPDPLGRAVGDTLWPERFDPEYLESNRRMMGSSIFNALYQGRPAPAEGNVFKRDWLRYWRPLEVDGEARYDLGEGKLVNPKDCVRLLVADLATSTKQTADFTVLQVWDITPTSDMILVHQTRRRMEGPDILPALEGLYSRFQPELVGVESAGFQIAIIQEARRRGLPVVELKAEKDKLSRALTASAKMEAGQLFLERDAPYLDTMLPELLSFPNAAHDDQVDPLAYAAIEAQKRVSDWMSVYAPNHKRTETVEGGENPWMRQQSVQDGLRALRALGSRA